MKKESDKQNVKILKKMNAEDAKHFLRKTSPETAKRLLQQSGHDPNCLKRAKKPSKAFGDVITLTDEIRARALGIDLSGGEDQNP